MSFESLSCSAGSGVTVSGSSFSFAAVFLTAALSVALDLLSASLASTFLSSSLGVSFCSFASSVDFFSGEVLSTASAGFSDLAAASFLAAGAVFFFAAVLDFQEDDRRYFG